MDKVLFSLNMYIIRFQMTTLLSHIVNIQSRLRQEVKDLREQITCNSVEIEKCKTQAVSNSLKIDENSEEIMLLQENVAELSLRSYIKKEEKIPYVFSAPPRNRYFAGRTEEIQKLKRILEVDDVTMNEKKVRVVAVSGLGGIGKTSLVAEYAHLMKDFYKGGVYWFSAEDDTFLDRTVTGVALKIDALLGSFDLTLSNILKKISCLNDPSLIVLDCLDQLDLSANMIKFLSFPSQENILGHFIVLTRRNPNRLVNEVSVFGEDSFIQLKCFLSEEAKQFICLRTDADRDEYVESVAECLCEELGRLPLALEQAGTCIKMLRCSLSSYLEQYKTERLKLLSQQKARPVSPGNESPERLAVHTTWLINMEYMKKSANGPAAVRFMNACSFFSGNEIEKELINVGTPEVEDVVYRECVSSPLGCRQILKLLTDFSLFTDVDVHSISTHRLIQELVKESLDSDSKAQSLVDAARMLSYAFSNYSSPSDLVRCDESNGEEQNIAMSDLPKSPNSHFYMWSKFCMHGHHLWKNVEDLLATSAPSSLDLWFPGTAKILYECAVHLSANYKQEEAKRMLNFCYRVLDWMPFTEHETVKSAMSNNSLFPISIPIAKSLQVGIKQSCTPPFVSLKSLPEKSSPTAGGFDVNEVEKKIELLRLDGNKSFEEGHYNKALDTYSSAIKLAQAWNIGINPFLLTNRATCYIKLNQYEDALKDANDYITRRPDCWRGYARKALAHCGLNENVSAEIAAALAFHCDKAVFSDFYPFKKSFCGLQERIFICDNVDQLVSSAKRSLQVETNLLIIIVLSSNEYVLNPDNVVDGLNLGNCILVGTGSSVVLKFEKSACMYLLNKCMITNLSFFMEEGFVSANPGSVVKVLNCNFAGKGNDTPIVFSYGKFNAEKCCFDEGNNAGLACFEPGDMVVVDCSFVNNKNASLFVTKGGTLLVKDSRIYNNESGLRIGSEASKCVVSSCDIYQNDRCGIFIKDSKNVKILRNNIFDNVGGLLILNSEVDIRDNSIFDDGMWGIWSVGNSWCNISMNRIFRNKAGGVRVGFRLAGQEFPPSVVERNEIYDNFGPGIAEGDCKFKNNKIHNNKGTQDACLLNFAVSYCSNCRKKCEPMRCEKCFTAAYCNETCLVNHLSKHENICKVLRHKTSFLITSRNRAGYDGMIKRHAKALEEIGPKFSPPAPPRDGQRFVVKVQTVKQNFSKEKSNSLLLYDRSLELYEEFESKIIAELVQEFGIPCQRQLVEKKLFLYCLFEENGHLRIFTNEFSDFLNW